MTKINLVGNGNSVHCIWKGELQTQITKQSRLQINKSTAVLYGLAVDFFFFFFNNMEKIRTEMAIVSVKKVAALHLTSFLLSEVL